MMSDNLPAISLSPSPPSIPMSIFRQGLLRDAVVVVTGGGTGIGRGIALEAATLGATVFIASRRLAVLEAAAKEMNSILAKVGDAKGNVIPVVCDIRSEASIVAMLDAIRSLGMVVTHLVNCGGGQFLSPAENISSKGWKSVVDLNLNGTFQMIKATFDGHKKNVDEALTRGVAMPKLNIVNIVADMFRGFPLMV